MGDKHLKSQIRSDKDKDRLILIALLAIPAVFLWFILTAVLTRSAALTGQLFFGDTNDTFMDFFNCLKSAADRDPYNEVNMVQYPPLCELIFYLIGRMAPEGLVYTNPYHLREVQATAMAFALFIFIPIILSVYAIEDMSSLSKGKKRLLVLSVLLSSPFLFAFERGNIILYSYAFTLIFIAYRNSGNKIKREIALICLALAFAIKIYPAAFGIFLIREKKFKEAIRCAIYGALAFFLPFLCFGGLGKFLNMIGFLTERSDVSEVEGLGVKINFATLIRYFTSRLFGASEQAAWPQTVAVLLGIALILASIFLKKNYMSALAIALVIAGLPGYSYFYVAVFFTVAFVMFFEEENIDASDLFTLALLIVATAPYPVTLMVPEHKYSVTIMQILTGAVMLVLTILLIFFAVRDLIGRVGSKHLLKQDGRND